MRGLARAVVIAAGAAWASGCLATASAAAADAERPAILPTPKSLVMGRGTMPLTPASRIVVADPALERHAAVLSDEILLLTDMRLARAKGEARPGDIVLKVNPSLRADADILAVQDQKVVRTRDMAHTIEIADAAVVEGWDFRAVCEGTATLVQSIAGRPGGYHLPRMKVKDWPYADYTGAMIDCGRQWIPADTLKAAVECCRMFKVRYLQFHFCDDQGYSLPSKAFPRLGTQNQDCMGGKGAKLWTWEEMEDLEAFAAARGVCVVPELETPGHHGAMGRCYRDVFDGPGCMDMASEELYKGLDTVVGELCGVFKSTPYFHIGCDEANNGCGAGPWAQVYKRRHAYPFDAQSIRNGWEIYVVHMFRMSEIVRRHGKVPIAWENFPDDARLSNDIIAMVWYPHAVAHQFQQKGFTTITVPWDLGVPFPEWNMFHCNGSRLRRTDRVLGASRPMWQMSRLCVVNGWMLSVSERQERTWGPDTPLDEKEFRKREAAARERATRLATPVRTDTEGLVLGGEHFLTGRMTYAGDENGGLTVTLSVAAPSGGRIHYTLDGSEPTTRSPAYERPLRLSGNFTLNAALFLDGRQMGSVSRHEYLWRDAHGYIRDWKIAGPYTAPGKTGAELFDVEFPPEKGGQARWIRHKPGEIPWMVALSDLPGYAGDDRVAYMRTLVWSPKAQEAELHVGSDDGVKVFLNGKVVHGVNRGRGVAEEDRVGVSLNEGWNELLLKVTNWTGGWAAKGRVRAAGGGRLEGFRTKVD